MQKLIFILMLLASLSCYAEVFAPDTSYEACFTPNENCTQAIVSAINAAKTQILVQAYSFTSRPIAKALIQAKNRSVTVKVLLDKSAFEDKPAAIRYILASGIDTKIDYLPNDTGIAHNKIMIIDGKTVITGSFNFTTAAQKNNAENILIINDSKLAESYQQNWYNRAKNATATEVINDKANYNYRRNRFRLPRGW